MTNLLTETREAIADSGHTPGDITFIGSLVSGHRCTWEKFEELANFDYDSGFGAAEIAKDLQVVFKDGQTMWRGEYDGSEWWEYSTPAVIPTESHPIRSLGGNGYMWVDLAELNAEPETAS